MQTQIGFYGVDVNVNVRTTERGNNAAVTDRFSDLPEEMKHHILSFLPTRDAIRTSVLSKAAHLTWTTFTISNFSGSILGLGFCSNKRVKAKDIRDRIEKFMHFVQNTWLRQCQNNTRPKRFELSMVVFPDAGLNSLINQCTRLALQSGVEELNLQFDARVIIPGLPERYQLPLTILSSKALTVLKLELCLLILPITNIKKKPTLPYFYEYSIRWPCLRVLQLKWVHCDEKFIQGLIFTCPLIEKICLLSCVGLQNIRLSGFTKLNHVEVIGCSLKKLEVNVPSLRALHFQENDSYEPDIEIAPCNNLEVLEILSSTVDPKIFQHLVSKSPALKTLSLYVRSLERIRISGKKIERLELYSRRLLKAIIDTPSLKSFTHCFQYATATAPPLIFVGKPSPRSIFISDHFRLDLQTSSFLKMREYLGNFKYIRHLTLMNICPRATFLPQDLEDFSLPPFLGIKCLELKHTTVSDCKEHPVNAECNYQGLLNGLLWICHPESLIMCCKSECYEYNNGLIKVLCEELMHIEDHCMSAACTKCWRHDLKGFQIEQVLDSGGTKPLTCDALLESLPTLPQWQMINFLFIW